MREKPYNFITTDKAEENVLVDENTEVAQEPANPEAAAEKPAPAPPAAPEKSFFEKYKLLLLILLVVAIVVFFWKFKIVSKAAQIVTA